MLNLKYFTRLLVLALTLDMSALTVSAAARYDFITSDLCFKVLSNQNKTVSIVGYNPYQAEPQMLSIPSNVTWNNNVYTVTEVGPHAFEHFYIETLYLPSDIARIGEYAFCECSYLKSVTLPANLKTIGEGAFWKCRITSLIIPEGVDSIEASAFHGCRELESLKIPDSVTFLGEGAFQFCDGLSSVKLGRNIQRIGQQAFGYCSSLSEITIPNSVKVIDDLTFVGCI